MNITKNNKHACYTRKVCHFCHHDWQATKSAKWLQQINYVSESTRLTPEGAYIYENQNNYPRKTCHLCHHDWQATKSALWQQ
jgi:hypothetical protein